MSDTTKSMTARMASGGSLERDLSARGSGASFAMNQLLNLSVELPTNVTGSQLKKYANRNDKPLALDWGDSRTGTIQSSLNSLYDSGYSFDQIADYINKNRRL